MKLYSKILGILNVLILLSGILILIVNHIETKNWLVTFLLLFPIYFFAHYLIITKFGFFSNNTNKQNGRFIILLTACTFVLIGIVPVTMYVKDSKAIKLVSMTKDWGETSTLYGIKTDLKTRFINNTLEYVFTANYNFFKERPEILSYTIEFQDSDGFVIKSLRIEDWTNVMDSTSITYKGIKSTGSKSWQSFDAKKYLDIDKYYISIGSKK